MDRHAPLVDAKRDAAAIIDAERETNRLWDRGLALGGDGADFFEQRGHDQPPEPSNGKENALQYQDGTGSIVKPAQVHAATGRGGWDRDERCLFFTRRIGRLRQWRLK